MDPEIEPAPPALEPPSTSAPGSMGPGFPADYPEDPYRGLKWIFVGPHGLRTGWSVLIFLVLTYLLLNGFAFLFLKLQLTARGNGFNPRQQLFSELLQVLALLSSAAIMAVIEGRKILDYNLRGARRVMHFF